MLRVNSQAPSMSLCAEQHNLPSHAAPPGRMGGWLMTCNRSVPGKPLALTDVLDGQDGQRERDKGKPQC